MCENLMDREKAIDFRPHSHNLLCSADTFFDSRYNAHLKLEKVLDNLYTQILHENHLDLATQLAMTIRKTLCSLRGGGEEGVSEASFKKPKREVSFCNVPVSYIVSGLASEDRSVLIEYLVDFLQEEFLVTREYGEYLGNDDDSRTYFIDIGCTNHDCVQSLLSEIAEGLRVTADKMFKSDKRKRMAQLISRSKINTNANASALDTVNDENKYLRTMIDQMPLKAMSLLLESMNSFSSNSVHNEDLGLNKSKLIVFLRHGESIDANAFSDLVLRLNNPDLDYRMHIVVMQEALCPLPLRSNKSAQSVMDVYLYESTSSWECYDDFMGRFITQRKIPLALPSTVWSTVHDAYWRSNCCLFSAVNKLKLSLGYHFIQRRSLLCMFEEFNFLLEMKLIDSGKKRDKDEVSRSTKAISVLLSYMGANDIEGTGLRLVNKDDLNKKGNSAEVEYAKTILVASLHRLRIDQSWFRCLREARDRLLGSAYRRDIADKKKGYFSDILWAAVTCPTTESNRFRNRHRNIMKALSDISAIDPCAGTPVRAPLNELHVIQSDVHETISSLVSLIEKNIDRVPISNIHTMIQNCKSILEGITGFVGAIYDSFRQEEESPLSPQKARKPGSSDKVTNTTYMVFHDQSVIDWEVEKAQQISKMDKLRDELDEHFLMFEYMFETMKDAGFAPTACQAELPKKMGSAKKMNHARSPLPVAGMSPETNTMISSLSSSKGHTSSVSHTKKVSLFDSPKKSSPKKRGRDFGDDDDDDDNNDAGKAEATALVSQEGDDATVEREVGTFSATSITTKTTGTENATNMIQSPSKDVPVLLSPTPRVSHHDAISKSPITSASRLAGLMSPVEGTTYEGSMYAFTGFGIEDFLKWLKDASSVFASVPRIDPVEGILDMATDSIQNVMRASNGNTRSIEMDALMKDTSGFNAHEDIAILSKIIGGSQNTVNIFDWYDQFKDQIDYWDMDKKVVNATRQGSSRTGDEEHSKNTKSSKIDKSGDSEERKDTTIMKCRFAVALANCERVGLIKIKNNGNELMRLSYMWSSL